MGGNPSGRARRNAPFQRPQPWKPCCSPENGQLCAGMAAPCVTTRGLDRGTHGPPTVKATFWTKAPGLKPSQEDTAQNIVFSVVATLYVVLESYFYNLVLLRNAASMLKY